MFIKETIKPLYPYCNGISVISQYDRDYYGNMIEPDNTLNDVLSFPDPEGKINLVIRKFKDEAVARNHEMAALLNEPYKSVITHSVSMKDVLKFHQPPDYFLIVDGDEIYDIDTLPRIIDYLKWKKPRGMRINAFNYYNTWNRRVKLEDEKFCHFGFIKAGIFFKIRRIVSLNEIRLLKYFKKIGLGSLPSILWGFIECPSEIGVFHHAAYIGGEERIKQKMKKSSHSELKDKFQEQLEKLNNKRTEYVPIDKLPINIREGNWEKHLFE
ncbi:MAG: hypothetical protein ACK40G_16515 [Cytophagaceae bacterium]